MTDVIHNPISAIQLAGCLKLPNPSAESRELVRAVAAAYYGSYYYLDAPLYLQSADLKQQLIKEPLLQDTLKETENMSAVITGIGSKSSLPITNPIFSPYISDRDYKQLDHCLGSIYGYILDKHGQIADIDLNQKVVAAPIENILKADHRIAVVYGRHKANITYQALKNHLINEILTDTDTALNLLDLAKS